MALAPLNLKGFNNNQAKQDISRLYVPDLGGRTAYPSAQLSYSYTPSKSVLPASTQAPASQPTPTPISGGGGGNGGFPISDTRNPGHQSWLDNNATNGSGLNADEARRKLLEEVDSAYSPIDGILNQMESTTRGGEQNYIDQYTKEFDALNPILDQNYNTGVLRNQEQISGVQQREANALSEARRQYQELGMGVRQRFGGTNSAGEMAQAYMGREYQRNTGKIRNDAGQNYYSLGNDLKTIESEYGAKKASIVQQRAAAEAKAKDSFSQRLSEINNNRLLAAQNKAQLKLGALQELRSQLSSIAQNAYNFDQTLASQVNQQKLNLAAQIEAFKAQAGQNVNMGNISNAVYSQFGQPLTPTPSFNLNSIYGYAGNREEDRNNGSFYS